MACFPFRGSVRGGSGRKRQKKGSLTRDIAKGFTENYRGREIMSFDNATIRIRWTNERPVDKEIRVCEEIRPPSMMKRLLVRSAANYGIRFDSLTWKTKTVTGILRTQKKICIHIACIHRCNVSKIKGRSFCCCHRQQSYLLSFGCAHTSRFKSALCFSVQRMSWYILNLFKF